MAVSRDNIDVRISVSRKGFLWEESSLVTKKFFELLGNKKAEFSTEKIMEMALFYTGDVEMVHDVIATITRNDSPMKKGDNLDVIVEMLVEGKKSCSRIKFFLNDYKCRGISQISQLLVKDKAEIKKFTDSERLKREAC